MPTNHPEDRVRIKNIIDPKGDDRRTVVLHRMRKEKFIDANGQERQRDVPYEEEVDWNYDEGFLFFWGGKPYVLKKGETRSYPRFLAEHAMSHMIQHILNDKHDSTKRLTPNGIYMFDQNILNNESLKKQLRQEIFVGVEEYYEAGDEDLDRILNKEFGGDLDSMIEKPEVNKEDVILKEEEQDDKKLEIKQPKVRTKSNNADLEKIRDEYDAYGFEWNETESVDELKTRLIKLQG